MLDSPVMVTKPVIFISATSDLHSARDLVGKILYSMGYEPHWQDIAPTDGGELLAVLKRWIDPSELVIQLVGSRYGAEPPQPTAEFGRVSYTQFEALRAEKIGKKVIYHFIEPAFPVDDAAAEPAEVAQLQAAYRDRVKAANKLWQANIASPQDLELSIRRIKDDLEAIRNQSDRRFRRTARLIAAALAGVIVTAGLAAWVLHEQRQTHETVVHNQTDTADQLAAIRTELREALAPKPLASKDAQPEPLPPALIAKAKILLEQGNAEDRALAEIALKHHAEADRLIQELKAKPGNPIDEAARLLTMEGDNWYQANQPDKAIEPYEKALALRPRDVSARNHVTLAHDFAPLGNITNHQRRAIEIAEGTLKIVVPGSADWAATQNNLGIAWGDMPTGDGAENLRKAIAAYEAALTVRTKEAAPAAWAATQNNLGNAWRDLPTGDRAENLRRAIAAFEAALTVYTKDTAPAAWAATQSNLGNAWACVPTGDQAGNLRKAIALYEAALTVFTKDAAPAAWAVTQNNLGLTWSNLPTGDRAESLRRAIAAYEAALTVRTRHTAPAAWATTQNNLGNAWGDLPGGDRAANLRKAIAAYEAALTVRTKDAAPAAWGMTHHNMAEALANLADLPGSDRAALLARAIASDKAALLVYTAEAFPREHADALENLESHRKAYEAAGGAKVQPFDAIRPAE